jgi:drug/metabolite transporter (DMT)-like permease
MLTIVLALGSALMYGLSDFFGGVLSRRTSVWTVAVVTQVTALVAIGAAALVVGGRPAPDDWMWGAIAGIGTGTGTGFLYRGLAGGRMSVVAPLSAVGAALVPVVVGTVTGERPPPIVWGGIVLALPAIWLIATTTESPPSETAVRGATSGRLGAGVVDGVLAGLGFGLMFAALGQVPDEAGFGPLAAAEVTSIPAVIALAVVLRQPWVPRDRDSIWAIGVGALAAGASVLFLLATQAGLLTVASVLASLYPAFTVLLAAVVLGERVHRSQAVGLGLALAAVAMIASG